jgi:hypothetical protein
VIQEIEIFTKFVTKNALHFLVFLWQFFDKKFSLTHTLFQLVLITSNTLLIIFTSRPINKCNIKHKLCMLRDNLHVNSLRADKNESFLRHMEITVLLFFLANNNHQKVTLKEKKGTFCCKFPLIM